MMKNKTTGWILVCVLISVLTSACDSRRASSNSAKNERPVVVATTTMLEDLARQLGEPEVEVRGIMKPGGDPHLYQPTPADARLIASSRMVVTSGLYLEGWIDDLVRNAGGERAVVVASKGVEPIRMGDSPGGVDPHFWFDLGAWRIATDNVANALVQIVGPQTSEAKRIQARAQAYRAQVDALDAWVRAQLESVPQDQRVIITSHDAFNYFGRAYAIDVVGIQGISTEQEASQRDVANVVEMVRARNAPAVFVETSVNPALIKQVARETGAKIAGPLYSDSIGPANGPASTFVKMVAENVRIITEALGGQYAAFELEQDARPKKEAL